MVPKREEFTERGLVLLPSAEARALAEEDPTVKAGQLRLEAVTWWVGKGYMSFPKAPPAN